jgi:hypothetical protein
MQTLPTNVGLYLPKYDYTYQSITLSTNVQPYLPSNMDYEFVVTRLKRDIQLVNINHLNGLFPGEIYYCRLQHVHCASK